MLACFGQIGGSSRDGIPRSFPSGVRLEWKELTSEHDFTCLALPLFYEKESLFPVNVTRYLECRSEARAAMRGDARGGSVEGECSQNGWVNFRSHRKNIYKT